MSYLLYCILGASARLGPRLPPGLGGRPVFVVAQHGLSAVLSEVAESDSVPGPSQVLSYERVVEHFFRDQTVIPIRYGCRFETESEVISLLDDRQVEYQKLLNNLEGLHEMGIRVLIGGSGSGLNTSASRVPPCTSTGSSISGTAYLETKRERFLSQDREVLDQRLLVDDLCGPLSGLFVRRKVESSDITRSGLLSLYFLVPRPSVESFCQATRHLRPPESVKLLLSGPWPPYNFVDSPEG